MKRTGFVRAAHTLQGSESSSSTGTLQARHRRRTRRWASTPFTDEVIRVTLGTHVRRRITAPAAVLVVCRVDSTQVAGERRLHGDLGGFAIAHFTDHDDVRTWRRIATQGVGELKADLGMHLDHG